MSKRVVLFLLIGLITLLFLPTAVALDDIPSNDTYTGDGIRVGVIDLSYDITNDQIEDNVEGFESFGRHKAFNSPNSHGTAVAEVVRKQAPEADLYLAGVSNLGDGSNFVSAMDWMEKNNVDVVVASLGFFGQPNDGTSNISKAVDEAYDTGTLVVTSSGNEGPYHWTGSVNNSTLIPQSSSYPELSRFDIDKSPRFFSNSSYTLEMYVQNYNWKKPSGTYNITIERPNGSVVDSRNVDLYSNNYTKVSFDNIDFDPNVNISKKSNGPGNLQIFLITGTFQNKYPSYSLKPPATAKDSITVGACDPGNGNCQLEDFSSFGPTPDGRDAVDIVAPNRIETTAKGTFAGTSASAPYAAGVIARLMEKDPTLSLDEVSKKVTSTALKVNGKSGYGEGLVQPEAIMNLSKITVQEVVTKPSGIELKMKNTGEIGGIYSKGVSIVYPSSTEVLDVYQRFKANESTSITLKDNLQYYGTFDLNIEGKKMGEYTVSPNGIELTEGDSIQYLAESNLSKHSKLGETVYDITVLSIDGQHKISFSGLNPTRGYSIESDSYFPTQEGKVEYSVSTSGEIEVDTGARVNGSIARNKLRSLFASDLAILVGFFASLSLLGIYVFRKRRESEFKYYYK